MEEAINLEPRLATLTDDIECNELNRSLKRLSNLRAQIEEKGELTMDVALEHQVLTGSSHLVNAYFSTLGRQAKKQIATEGLYEQAKSLLKKAMDLLWDMIVKVFNWLRKLFINKTPVTEAALDAAHQKFKDAMGPVQRAERVPSSRTAILAAVREKDLDAQYVAKLTPEEMDIYNEGPFHQAIQRMIPALDGFDVASVVESLMGWHDKYLPAAKKFDQDNRGMDAEAVQKRLDTFKKDATRDLESQTQMATKLMEIRLESYQKAIEARRKLKADPNFYLGTDLSGIMARGVRIFEQSGYKKMGNALTDVFKSLEKTVSRMEGLRSKAQSDLGSDVPGDGSSRAAEEMIEAAYMKEVNRIISTLHQCVTMIQLINNYFSYVMASTRTILSYVKDVGAAAIGFGGDQATLSQLVQTAQTEQEQMEQVQANREQYGTEMQ